MSRASGIQEEMIKGKWTLSVAESCTGGGVAAEVTAVAGCSAYFRGGVVAYHDEIKHRLLGVSDEILKIYGAVSEPCVAAMAAGVAKLFQTTHAMAISGIAGPTGGGEKPVGTVCFAIHAPDKQWTWTKWFDGEREEVMRQALTEILRQLEHHLKQGVR